MDLDDLQEKLGGVSAYQVFVISLFSLVILGTSTLSQTSVFFSAVPDYRCAVPPIDNATLYPNLTEENITYLIVPPGEPCYRYAYNLSECSGGNDFSCITNQSEVGLMECDQGFHYDDTYYEETTVSEWDLICGGETLDSLANSLYYFGMFIGSASVGPLMDWFGRKLSMLIYVIVVIISGVACAFSPSYGVYAAMRVLQACGSLPCYIVYFTYVSEISDQKKRTFFGSICNLVSALSHTLLPGLAYLLRDWRNLCLVCTLIATIYFVIYFFVPRSPRWLLSKGRSIEARGVVNRYARSKKTKIGEEDWELVVKTEQGKFEETSSARKYNVVDLFRLPFMRILSLNIMYVWFTASMVFYGLVLNVGKLAGNPYVNATLNALVEILAYLTFYFGAKKFGRRLSMSASFLLGGICCLLAMLFMQFANGNNAMIEASRWIAIAGKYFATIAFALVYQITAELYPTVARGTAMSMGSMTARIGSMIMPFTLQIQTTIPWLTQTIFGTLSVLAGFTSLLFPETSSHDLMTSFEESEQFFFDQMKFLRKFIKNTPNSEKVDGKSKNTFIEDEKDTGMEENAIFTMF